MKINTKEQKTINDTNSNQKKKLHKKIDNDTEIKPIQRNLTAISYQIKNKIPLTGGFSI